MLTSILEQTVNGLMAGSVYVLIALGMVLIYGVMHVLNFAHGVLFMLGGYVCHFIFTRVTGSYLLAIVLSMAVLAAISVSRWSAACSGPCRGTCATRSSPPWD